MKKAIIILSSIAAFILCTLTVGIVYSKYHTVETRSSSVTYNIKNTTTNSTTTPNSISINNNLHSENKTPIANSKSDKIVYLTFDDGPSNNITPQILDTLKKNDVKATFFVLGRMCERNPDMLKRIKSEGHCIANHSYSHNYKYLYSSTNNFISDITKCNDTIVSIIGPDYNTKLVRFPGGAFSKKMLPYKRKLEKLGYSYVNWNASVADSAYLHVPVDRMLKNVKAYTAGKKEVILLMHDSEVKDTTAEALPKIIEYFKSNGYRFETLKSYKKASL